MKQSIRVFSALLLLLGLGSVSAATPVHKGKPVAKKQRLASRPTSGVKLGRPICERIDEFRAHLEVYADRKWIGRDEIEPLVRTARAKEYKYETWKIGTRTFNGFRGETTKKPLVYTNKNGYYEILEPTLVAVFPPTAEGKPRRCFKEFCLNLFDSYPPFESKPQPKRGAILLDKGFIAHTYKGEKTSLPSGWRWPAKGVTFLIKQEVAPATWKDVRSVTLTGTIDPHSELVVRDLAILPTRAVEVAIDGYEIKPPPSDQDTVTPAVEPQALPRLSFTNILCLPPPTGRVVIRKKHDAAWKGGNPTKLPVDWQWCADGIEVMVEQQQDSGLWKELGVHKIYESDRQTRPEWERWGEIELKDLALRPIRVRELNGNGYLIKVDKESVMPSATAELAVITICNTIVCTPPTLERPPVIPEKPQVPVTGKVRKVYEREEGRPYSLDKQVQVETTIRTDATLYGGVAKVPTSKVKVVKRHPRPPGEKVPPGPPPHGGGKTHDTAGDGNNGSGDGKPLVPETTNKVKVVK